MTARHRDPGDIEGPLRLLDRTLSVLDAAAIPGVIIGSLALIEHLPENARHLVHTDDADVMVWIESEQPLQELESALVRGLGATKTPGKSGKWFVDGLFLDIVGRTIPHGLCGDVCFPEPFANVAFLDLMRPDAIRQSALLQLPSSARVAGPLVTCLGKALKVARYLRLNEWSEDFDRQARAARSLRDIVLVVETNPAECSAEAAAALLDRAHLVDDQVAESMVRALSAFVDLFVHGGLAIGLAEWDGLTSDSWRVTQELAHELQDHTTGAGSA